jgi:hypothetical protein
VLDHRHAAAETVVSLCQFEADVAAAQHDQVLGQPVEFERLDVGERLGAREAGGGRDRRARPHVKENPLARQHARAAVAQTYLERFRRHEPPIPHDQLGAALPVQVQVQSDQPLDHLALPLAHLCHVNRDGPVTIPNCAASVGSWPRSSPPARPWEAAGQVHRHGLVGQVGSGRLAP